MAYGPIIVNLTLEAYTGWPIRFTVVNAAGAVQSLSGATAIWVLKIGGANGEEVLRKTVGDGITITDAAAGQLVVSVSDTETQDLREGYYYHELRLTIGGVDRAAAKGAIIVPATAIRS